MTREQIEQQLRLDNPTTTDDAGNRHGPGSEVYEAAIQRWADAMEAQLAAVVDRKIWHTVADFWAEFSDTEKLAIADSTIAGIRLLHEELRMWRGEVWSDDPKVQAGLTGLVAVGILTESRKTEILTK